MKLYNYQIVKNTRSTEGLTKECNKIFLSQKELVLSESCQKFYKFNNNQGREISLCLLPHSFVFEVENVASFECFSKTNEIFYQLHKEGSQELLEYWFTHTLLPIFFTVYNKYYFLHAGAVMINKKSVLFMADSMGGKSTTTDYFVRQGHTMISDDKVGTFEEGGRFKIVSSYPYRRPYRKFEDLGIKVENFKKSVTSLDLVYMLDISTCYKSVEFVKLKGIEKVSLLIRGTDINLPFLQEERFAYITRLANATPVYRVKIPKELERLGEVYSAIVKHTKEV